MTKIEMRFTKVKWSRDSECYVALFDAAFDGEWRKDNGELAEFEIERMMTGADENTLAALPELQRGLDAVRAKERAQPVAAKADMIGGDGEE